MAKEKTIKLLILVLVAAVIVPQITLAAWWNPVSWGLWGRIWSVFHKQVVCTQEAKQCPDGSYVSRQGPKCEFAPCPNCTCPSDSYILSGDLCMPKCSVGPGPVCTLPGVKCELDQTAGWKTYTNTQYSFEIKFPIDKILSPDSIPGNVIEGSFYYDASYREISIGALNSGCLMFIYPNIDNKFLSTIKNTDIKQLLISENNGKKYFIGYSAPSHAISVSECLSAFDKIIPTFKLIK